MTTLESRVAALENQLNALMLKGKKPLVKIDIPKNYICILEFARKYKFVSNSYIGSVVRKNKEYFKDFTIKTPSRVFVDPLRLFLFLLHDFKNQNTFVVKAFNKWMEFVPALKDIPDQLKEKFGVKI